ncbi:MAG: stage II sporulation protein M [Leadbetterella sp.]
MREAAFIKKNQSKWQVIEEGQENDPDIVASNFIDLVSDLSYAKTHYPHSKITFYINYLASNVYKWLNSAKKKNPIKSFFTYDIPLVLGQNHKILWFATAYFLCCCFLGVLFSYVEPDFINSIMGQDYVQMTEKNIKNGKPFEVYNLDKDPFLMFLRIFANNFFVGLILFVSGMLLGIGTIYFTFKNGVMVGAFLTMFVKHKLGTTAFFIIMQHGTLELTGLILECTAGLILGFSFMLPQTLSRKEAFKKGLKESAMIFISTIPITFLAAVIESYVTRFGNAGFKNLNVMVAVLLILIFVASWAFVIWYYFIYSYKLSKKVAYQDYLNDLLYPHQ